MLWFGLATFSNLVQQASDPLNETPLADRMLLTFIRKASDMEITGAVATIAQ
jgi:hypothetical protein